MKILSLLFVLLMSIQFHAQDKWIGVPIFDKHLRFDKCQTCEKIYEDQNLADFEGYIWDNSPEMNERGHSTQKMIDFYKSLLPTYADSPEKKELIYHALLKYQESLCFKIGYDVISPSDFKEYNQSIDQLLILNLNNATYLRQHRMYLYAQSGILDRISEEKISESNHEKMDNEKWYDINNTDYIEGEDWKNLAKQYLADKENANGFIPFNNFLGLNLSHILYGNWNENNSPFFHGIEFSLDQVGNPDPVYIFNNRYRSFIGASYVKGYQGNDSEFMFNFYQLRNLLQLNLIQFGVYNHHAMDIDTWFWRPEIGLNIGIFNISYVYNLPFNSVGELRGSQIKLGVGFPLIRLGKYF